MYTSVRQNLVWAYMYEKIKTSVDKGVFIPKVMPIIKTMFITLLCTRTQLLLFLTRTTPFRERHTLFGFKQKIIEEKNVYPVLTLMSLTYIVLTMPATLLLYALANLSRGCLTTMNL